MLSVCRGGEYGALREVCVPWTVDLGSWIVGEKVGPVAGGSGRDPVHDDRTGYGRGGQGKAGQTHLDDYYYPVSPALALWCCRKGLNAAAAHANAVAVQVCVWGGMEGG